MKKVLIALDYNPTAQKVAEVGYSVAKSMNAKVTLLHILTEPMIYTAAGYSPVMGYNGYENIGTMLLNSNEELKKASLQFLDKSKQHLGDDTIHTIIKEGDYADSILETAKEIKADIIVIGSHSRRWLENVLMGSITEKVLHDTKIPLLIVPTKKSK